MNVVAIKENREPLRMTLGARTAIVALALFLEKLALTFLVDYGPVTTRDAGFAAIVGTVQHVLFRFAAAFVLSLAVFAFAHDEKRKELRTLSLNTMKVGERWRWLVLHIALVLVLGPLSFYRYRFTAPIEFDWLIGLSILTGLGAVAALFAGLAPWDLWLLAAKRLGSLLIYAAVAAGIAVTATQWSQSLWVPASELTFRLVWYILAPFIPSLAGDAHTLTLSSNVFSVHIANTCSGLEGAGLMISFCSAWLICFRKEYVFPRALLLVPAGLLISLALNVARIACLMLIGYSGYPGIAVYGFHSQAGWIAFICAAGLIAVASHKIHWIRSGQSSILSAGSSSTEGARQTEVSYTEADCTAAYLLPFLALLAGAMIAKSFSAGFEYWYVLRPLLGIAALIGCWPRLRSLDWSLSWRGPLVGIALFIVYVIGDFVRGIHGNMPAALMDMTGFARIGWLSTRVGAAVLVVPVAEELAFRGYLMRRLVARDFESLPFGEVHATGLVVSALVYGLENRSAWPEATVVGLLLGILLIRRRRMGEIVAAHAVVNGLLAICVIFFGQWQFWM